MGTIVKPPPLNVEKSIVENALELTPLTDIGPVSHHPNGASCIFLTASDGPKDIFTNTRPLWHPPGARGVYGGAVIAQCLSAAQRTVHHSFSVHSMHCYFVLAGNPAVPIVYHVERVREGRSYATRTVQARQRGKPIFTTTMSFMKEGAGAGGKPVRHAVEMPEGLEGPWEEDASKGGAVESWKLGLVNEDSPDLSSRKIRRWVRARGKISSEGGHQAHLSALAYMSDSYFIGTVARIHKLDRGAGWEERKLPSATEKPPQSSTEEETGEERPEISMMVSLDHTIYFHSPRDFRADEWFLTEAESPWAGDGRGVVVQKIWTQGGMLVATCFQEGVVRTKPDAPRPPPKEKESKL
ncbi:hypothetical protein FGG08_003577 [Glutinoglossum americanum]|uniref:Acyl-CoA thioesterase II n=1 Tax=Glutinoglossum americanum TaxID=1670608 RepID=A0A9P8L3B8_9PEZI|nr:hypothetical protein FGG08_003577 [Glutinoglossum americanum]